MMSTGAIKENPLISFVLPTKNSMPQLANAMEAVFLQSYDRWEIVIQDGLREREYQALEEISLRMGELAQVSAPPV